MNLKTRDRFRAARPKRPGIHPAEKFLLGIVMAHLCFLPWALGAMHVWSQCISLGLSVAEFALALLPRDYDAESSGQPAPIRLALGRKLIKLPAFWIGAAFLLTILTQALNPAWRYVQTNRYWWLERIPHVAWLPSGMDTPFAMANPWRSLLIYGSAWMTLCAVWVGFTRRKTLRILFTVLAANAFVLALLGIAERALNADRIFWSWRPPASYFVASFIYKNHAGAYFDLLLSLCAGLACWHHERSRQRLDKSSPSGLFAFFATVLALIVVFSYSRAATLLMLAFFCVLALYLLGRRFFSAGRPRHGLALGLLCAAFGGFCALGFYSLPTGKALARMDHLMEDYRSGGPDSRFMATRATLDLFRASPAYGWGAGSFRFAFPIYQQRYPSIYTGSDGRRLFWEHAHNDYAELLAEMGVAGAAMISLGGAYYLIGLIRLRFWENSLSLLLFAGCALTLAHSWVDFNFYNPAILITWCAFGAALWRWTELQRGRISARSTLMAPP